MVLISLQICATLDGIALLSCKKEDFVWHLKLKCSNCNEVTAVWQDLSRDKPVETAGGRGVTHFGAKCKMCKKDIRITILADTVNEYTAKDSGTFKSVVSFDCRGGEPIDYEFGYDWRAKTDHTSFDDVDLTEDGGDWCDWDDKMKRAVSISNAKFNFIKIKQKGKK